jgi:hypothetical protein
VPRRLVIALFVCTAPIALLQDAVRRQVTEPFPALLMPSFASSPDVGRTYTISRGVLSARSATGETLTAPATDLTQDAGILPDSVIRLIAFQELTPDGREGGGEPRSAVVRRLAGQRRGRTREDARAVIDDPEVTRWLRERTADVFERHDVTAASVTWHRIEIDRDTEAVVADDVVKRVELFPR